LAKINQDLIDWIARDMGITPRAVYPHISRVANETMLDRHHAALVLAARRQININRYSTPEERAEIRSVIHTGRNSRDSDEAPGLAPEPRRRGVSTRHKPAKKRVKDNTIFVVHGRDEAVRKSMFDFLRALDLNPKEWDHVLREARGNNPFIGNALDEVMEKAQAVVVMFTPDDLVMLKEQFVGSDERNTEGKSQGQARPNVLFEAGLAMGRHADKTILVQVGRIKSFSDVAGRHIVKLSDSSESRNDLANRLEKIGCKIDKVGRDWLKVGNFVPTELKSMKRSKR
jgi:predicted nucleotide-binding protein